MDTATLFVVLWLGGTIAAWLLFVLPSIIAFRRRHPSRWAILGINLLLGATGIGWLGSLVWALQGDRRLE